MQEFTNKYVIGFAVAICVGCSLLIAGTALSLKEVQERNAEVDMKLNVLRAAGLVESGKSLSQEDVLTSFTEQITAKVVDISTGEILEGEEVASLSTAAQQQIFTAETEPNKTHLPGRRRMTGRRLSPLLERVCGERSTASSPWLLTSKRYGTSLFGHQRKHQAWGLKWKSPSTWSSSLERFSWIRLVHQPFRWLEDLRHQ